MSGTVLASYQKPPCSNGNIAHFPKFLYLSLTLQGNNIVISIINFKFHINPKVDRI